MSADDNGNEYLINYDPQRVEELKQYLAEKVRLAELEHQKRIFSPHMVHHMPPTPPPYNPPLGGALRDAPDRARTQPVFDPVKLLRMRLRISEDEQIPGVRVLLFHEYKEKNKIYVFMVTDEGNHESSVEDLDFFPNDAFVAKFKVLL